MSQPTLAPWLSDEAEADFVRDALKWSEADRRKNFRPHWEYQAENGKGTRRPLHRVMRRLLRVEVAYSTGCQLPGSLADAVGVETVQLLRSKAVAQFVDDYDYFGVRFLVDRLNRPFDAQIATLRSTLATAKDKQQLVALQKRIAELDVLRIHLGSLPDIPAPHRIEVSQQWTDPDQKVEALFQKYEVLIDAPGAQAFFEFLEGKPVSVQGVIRPVTVDSHRFRQWLSGLQEENGPDGDGVVVNHFFEAVNEAAIHWCEGMSELYEAVEILPIQARFFIFDFHRMAKLFGAEISSAGVISFPNPEWYAELQLPLQEALRNLDPLQQRPERDAIQKRLDQMDRVRGVIAQAGSLACNLLLGMPFAEEYAERIQPGAPGARSWRQVYEEEVAEVARYRTERPETPEELNPNSFSVRGNLVGLAISGGGIRSATFGLGILEGLKEVDLLRRVDYLSTVSGGGFIGSWLSANAYRRPGWLRKASDWSQSIEHLRRYSNYLSPQVGFFSADTWTMLTIWSRNTVLMQLLLFLTMATVLLVPHALKLAFDSTIPKTLPDIAFAQLRLTGWEFRALAFLGAAISMVAWNLKKVKEQRGWGQAGVHVILIPMVFSGFIFTMLLWWYASALDPQNPAVSDYLPLLKHAWAMWWPTLSVLGVMLVILTIFSSANPKDDWKWSWLTIVPFGLVYVIACGILKLFLAWRFAVPVTMPELNAPNLWYVFTFGPPLVIWGFALAVVMLLGVLSRVANDEKREWWSRLGGWLIIYGGVWMALALAAIFVPLWVAQLEGTITWKWSSLAWLGTTFGGLMAGKSDSTNGEKGEASMTQIALEWVARLAPYVFVVGLVAALSSGIHAFLLYIDLDKWPESGTYATQYWKYFNGVQASTVVGMLVAMAAAAVLYALRLDINVFSLNNFYRNRLVRCYLGATRDAGEPGDPRVRRDQPFTGFDPHDDIAMSEMRHPGRDPLGATKDKVPPFTGPFHIVNCALNLGGSADLELHTRQSANFTFTPFYAGSGWIHRDDKGALIEPVKFAPLRCIKEVDGKPEDQPYYGGKAGSPLLGEVVATSGAAASPNQGYHTSPVVAFLMTVFNVRLGWWFPHPSKGAVEKAAPTLALGPLVRELFGFAGERGGFLNLSDGGHFENLAIYELVRRRCRIIIASDGECDPDLTFGSLGNLIRICETDFGAKIDLSVSAIRKDAETGYSASHCAVGQIKYSDGLWGWLIYMKSSMTSGEATSIQEYKSSHPTFPHETTADQFFSEDQFESYRLLGREIAVRTFRDVNSQQSFVEIARCLADLWTPKQTGAAKFIDHANSLVKLWDGLRKDTDLAALGKEIFQNKNGVGPDEVYCNQMFQLMENVYLDLQLDDTFDHPDNAGWKELFERWATSPIFQLAWQRGKATYGTRFRKFCQRELGLS